MSGRKEWEEGKGRGRGESASLGLHCLCSPGKQQASARGEAGQQSRVCSTGLCPSSSPAQRGSWPGRPSRPWLRRAWSWALGWAVLTLYLAEERGCRPPHPPSAGTCPWHWQVENDRPCWWSQYSTQLQGNWLSHLLFLSSSEVKPGP